MNCGRAMRRLATGARRVGMAAAGRQGRREDAQGDGCSAAQGNLARRGDPSLGVVVEALYLAETLAVRARCIGGVLTEHDILDGNGVGIAVSAPVAADPEVGIRIRAPSPRVSAEDHSRRPVACIDVSKGRTRLDGGVWRELARRD